ncbi:MAG: ComF family protein [Clostridia bacterium]|nr:ComF family protein [Clostridia bacterium]
MPLSMKAKRLWLRVIAWLFPERCIFCDEPIPSLTLCCEDCRRELLLIKPPLCPYCGMSKTDCNCRRRRHRYDRVAAPFYSDGAAHEGLLRLKRIDDPQAIAYFADQMAATVRREYGEESLHVAAAVPMMTADRYERGYNQSELLAKAVAERLGIPYVAVLTKCYATQPQKALSAWERAGNVLGAYDVEQASLIVDKTVLLVDDVLTTGATTDECAKMLKLYGAARVLCVTAAIRRPKPKKQ